MKETIFLKGEVIMFDEILNSLWEVIERIYNWCVAFSIGGEVLEETNHEREANKIYNSLSKIGYILWNGMMIVWTGGLWILWLLFKVYRNSKKGGH